MNIKSTLITTLLIGGLSSGAMAGVHHNKITMEEFHKLEKIADQIFTVKAFGKFHRKDLNTLYQILERGPLSYEGTRLNRSLSQDIRYDIMNDVLNMYKTKHNIYIDQSCDLAEIYVFDGARRQLSDEDFLSKCFKSDI